MTWVKGLGYLLWCEVPCRSYSDVKLRSPVLSWLDIQDFNKYWPFNNTWPTRAVRVNRAELKSSMLTCFTFNTLSLGIILSTVHWHTMVHWWTNMALERPMERGELRGPQCSGYTLVRLLPSGERVLVTEEAERKEKREDWHTRAEMTTFPLPNHRQHDPSQERARTCYWNPFTWIIEKNILLCLCYENECILSIPVSIMPLIRAMGKLANHREILLQQERVFYFISSFFSIFLSSCCYAAVICVHFVLCPWRDNDLFIRTNSERDFVIKTRMPFICGSEAYSFWKPAWSVMERSVFSRTRSVSKPRTKVAFMSQGLKHKLRICTHNMSA